MIYLDHNASTPVDARVFEVMVPFFKESWGNPSSPYRFGNQARAAVERARRRIADCIGCQPDELLFCSSGTESDNLALRGAVRALRHKGNHIVTSVIEHHAVLHTCQALENEGFQVTYVPVTSDGVVDVESLVGSLRDDTTVVSIMHANNETGVVQPVEEIAALAHKRGAVFHIDAVQSAGKLSCQLGKLGADLVTFSAHKLYGPKGTAALHVRRGTPLASVMTGGAQEFGLRAGTENVAGIVGFAEAMMLAFEMVESEGRRLQTLRDLLERGVMSAVREVRINGAKVPRVPNTSSLSFQGIDGESLALGLDMRGICVSTGSACSTGETEPSHVLLAMGLSPRDAQGTVRVSLGRETCEADVDTTVRALMEVVARLRQISSMRG
ncbi:MAG TPA: cysteine desulfurase family protein [Candidatus Aminicenantes bacterium]|nr:cysteine desulfurase family protein [Candidatus Aminicenantes bacterium]